MNRRLYIALSVLIVILLVVIAAGVKALFPKLETVEPAPGLTSVPVQEPVSKHAQDSVLANVAAPATEKVERQKDIKPQQPPAEHPIQTVTTEATARKAADASFTVKNCRTGKNNTLRQNKDKSLELIDETGKSLWTIPLEKKICGYVGQVDYYNNGKIQFLLAEGINLHLIDRLGREVEGFPMVLPFKAVKGPYEVQKGDEYMWCIETKGDPIYLNRKVTEILTETL